MIVEDSFLVPDFPRMESAGSNRKAEDMSVAGSRPVRGWRATDLYFLPLLQLEVCSGTSPGGTMDGRSCQSRRPVFDLCSGNGHVPTQSNIIRHNYD